jgi:AraC-like DNA-binding protein
MSVLFRAADEPRTSRADYWQHVVGDAFGALEVRHPGALESDQLRVGEIGPVRVAALSISAASDAERGSAHVRRSDPELYKIDFQRRGSGIVEQDGRQARQTPGDFVFVDLSRPSRWVYSPSEVVAVVFPRALLPLPPDKLARLRGVRIPGDSGAGALVSSLARRLPDHLDDGGAAERARLGTAVLDLVATALAARLDREQEVPRDSRQRALLLRIHAFIEARLGDAELSPRSIAAAHYISVRYLHKLFETEQATVADWVRRRRLERCRRDLLDPGLSHEAASTIADRWGFTSAAHFSRAFRAEYGLPPGEYRLIAGPHRPDL